MPHANVTSIFRYPVKGLSPEALNNVELKTGATLPYDRALAIENGHGRFDPLAPKHLPKINFLMLMRDEKLATLDTGFDADTQTLTLTRDGKQVAKGRLSDKIGRSMIEQFLAAYMADSLRGPPKIVQAEGHSFSDVAAKCVHIVNLESIRDLERVAGREINPLRFRANLYISGLPAWTEFSWLDKRVKIGAGGAEVAVFERTVRCDATNVDPETANRDMALPQLLQRTYGHSDFGIYARVTNDGTISVGDDVALT